MSLTAPDIMQTSPYGTLGAGVPVGVEPELLDFGAVPYTGTPPYGEPPLETAQEDWGIYAQQGGPVVAPTDPPINHQGEARFLHEQIHGTPWRGYGKPRVVNPSNPGVPNLGPPADPEGGFQSGHSQAIVHNPSAEQGWGLDPAILIPRFPASENINPFYAKGTHRRNGQMDWTPFDMPFGNVTQENVQLQWQDRKRRSTVHRRLLANPQPVAYTDTVPVGGQAGPLNIIPMVADEAIY